MKTCTGVWLGMLAFALFVTGCGQSDDENMTPTVDVTGSWVGTTDTGAPFNMTLRQNGGEVQGSVADGVLIGFVGSSEFDATIINTNGPPITIEATIMDNSMSGDYAIQAGGSGNFTATRK